jgi:hypothetical protein
LKDFYLPFFTLFALLGTNCHFLTQKNGSQKPLITSLLSGYSGADKEKRVKNPAYKRGF